MNNTKKNPATFVTGFFFGAPEETRTPDLLIRSQTLYPAELPAHTRLFSTAGYILPHFLINCKPFFDGNLFLAEVNKILLLSSDKQ